MCISTVAQLFQAHYVTEEQLKKAFDILDKDKSGTISTDELGVAMRSIGRASEEQLKEMIKNVDADKSGSGTLSFAEFRSLIMHQSDLEALRKAFDFYDTNKDGTITVHEARVGLRKQGVKSENIEKSLKKMFEDADFNNDDKINFEGRCL